METRPPLQERVLAKIREAEQLSALCEEAQQEQRPLTPILQELFLQCDTALRDAVYWTRIAIQTFPDNELDALIEEINKEEDMNEGWRETHLSSLAGTRWEHWSLAEWMDPGQTSER